MKSIASSNLPIGGMSNKPKTSSESISEGQSENDNDISESSECFASHQQSEPQRMHSNLNLALPIKPDPASSYWPAIIGYGNNQITLATPSPNSYHVSNHFHLCNRINRNIYCPSMSAMTGAELGSVGTSTMISYKDAPPTSVAITNSINDTGTRECLRSSSGNRVNNCTVPTQQEYQPGKPSPIMFQTPIFLG